MPTPPESLVEPKLLVVRIEVTNVDAVPDDSAEGYGGSLFPLSSLGPSYPYSNDAVDLWMSYVSATLAAFDGAPEGLSPQSPYRNDYVLACGESRVLTVAWWVEGSIDPSHIVVRPLLSASNPGPIVFELGL